jgi:hypothetical protein
MKSKLSIKDAPLLETSVTGGRFLMEGRNAKSQYHTAPTVALNPKLGNVAVGKEGRAPSIFRPLIYPDYSSTGDQPVQSVDFDEQAS